MTNRERIQYIINHELLSRHSKSGGHGGQNVNARQTKAEMYFPIDESSYLEEHEKKQLKNLYHKHISKSGILRVVCEEERYYQQNHDRAIEKLEQMLEEAMKVTKKRLPTSISLTILRERAHEKQLNGTKKKTRALVSHL